MRDFVKRKTVLVKAGSSTSRDREALTRRLPSSRSSWPRWSSSRRRGRGAQTTRAVNTPADGSGTAGCTTAPGGCTLRAAIDAAVAGDIVSVPAGTYVLTIGELQIDTSMSILGADARTTVISGNNASRVARISGSGTAAAISGVTLTGGNGTSQFPGSGQGGALFQPVNLDTSLTLTNGTISGNTAALGGGIASGGRLVMTGSTVSGNQANSAVAAAQGGGIYQALSTDPAGFAVIIASTVSGNSTTGTGGGIYAAGAVALDRTTIAGNTAATGSGLFSGRRRDAINDTIVTAATGTACGGDTTPITGTHNLSDDATCTFTDTGDIQNADPLLGTLQNNGGPTNTQALGAGSPAIGAANAGTCSGTDQRGVARPQQGTCDIGAFEYVPPPPPPPGLPPPVAGRLVNALPKSGTVKIKLPGRRRFRVLAQGEQIPVGTTIDTLKGRVTLVAAADKKGGTATSDFYGGIFKLSQTKAAEADHDLEAGREAQLPQARQGDRGGEEEEAQAVGGRQGPVPHPGVVQLGDRARHEVARPGQLHEHAHASRARPRDRAGLRQTQDRHP